MSLTDRIKGLRDRLTYDVWYVFAPPWDTGISPPELLDFIQAHEPGRAIDLGCGTGTNLITLTRAGWQAEGIDFSARAIRRARRKLQRANIECRVSVGDVTRMKGVAGPFELALDIGCFHSVVSREAYVTHLKRIVSPGGYWLMYGFVREDSASRGRGIGHADLQMIQSQGFRLLSRRDGTDHGHWPSAWFLHQKLDK
jgi:SAM-dependent methyltransferase